MLALRARAAHGDGARGGDGVSDAARTASRRRSADVLLDARGLRKYFPVRKGLLQRARRQRAGGRRRRPADQAAARRSGSSASRAAASRRSGGRCIRLIEPTEGRDLLRGRRPDRALALGAEGRAARDADHLPGLGRLARPAHARARRSSARGSPCTACRARSAPTGSSRRSTASASARRRSTATRISSAAASGSGSGSHARSSCGRSSSSPTSPCRRSTSRSSRRC